MLAFKIVKRDAPVNQNRFDAESPIFSRSPRHQLGAKGDTLIPGRAQTLSFGSLELFLIIHIFLKLPQ